MQQACLFLVDITHIFTAKMEANFIEQFIQTAWDLNWVLAKMLQLRLLRYFQAF